VPRLLRMTPTDAYTRLLSRLPPTTAALWQEVEPLVQRTDGLLVVDDTTLDKPYAHKMGLVTRHWSGKHHAREAMRLYLQQPTIILQTTA